MIGYLHSDKPERYCRNGEEIGDTYTCTYGCPVNQDGYGICSKVMMMLYPIMEAVRSGGDLENLGGDGHWGGREVLNLLKVKAQFLGYGCQFGHMSLGAAGVRRNEVWDKLLVEPVSLVERIE